MTSQSVVLPSSSIFLMPIFSVLLPAPLLDVCYDPYLSWPAIFPNSCYISLISLYLHIFYLLSPPPPPSSYIPSTMYASGRYCVLFLTGFLYTSLIFTKLTSWTTGSLLPPFYTVHIYTYYYYYMVYLSAFYDYLSTRPAHVYPWY